jgi:hypothetical protein
MSRERTYTIPIHNDIVFMPIKVYNTCMQYKNKLLAEC